MEEKQRELEEQAQKAEVEKGVMKESARLDVVHQLREARKGQGITQERLAEMVGTKKSNISRLESGRYNPSLDFLVRVAGGLGRQIQVNVK